MNTNNWQKQKSNYQIPTFHYMFSQTRSNPRAQKSGLQKQSHPSSENQYLEAALRNLGEKVAISSNFCDL